MKILMRDHITGSRNGVRWPQAGETVDLPEGEARDLIVAGLAEPIKAEAPKADEPKVAQPEKAVAPKATTRKR